MILYTSDSHLGHAKVIEYSRRPFRDVTQMDGILRRELRDAEATGATLIHCGDLSFNFAKWTRNWGPLFNTCEGKAIVFGNHDDMKGAKLIPYEEQFETLVGERYTWENHALSIIDELDGTPVSVLVSHAPQKNLWGCDINVHGHLHNDILLGAHRDGYEWSYDSDVHFNAAVELHGFKPVPLARLRDAHRRRYSDAEQWIV